MLWNLRKAQLISLDKSGRCILRIAEEIPWHNGDALPERYEVAINHFAWRRLYIWSYCITNITTMTDPIEDANVNHKSKKKSFHQNL